MKVKNVTLSKPWITKGLKSVRKKNLLYKRFLAKPTSYRENLYKCYKNKLTRSLRVAKRLYYNKTWHEYKSNAKSTWKFLNDLIDKKKSKCKLPSFFKSNKEEIFNPTHIANRRCEYFTNIGPDVAKSIPASDKSHRSLLGGSLIINFFLQTASEQEVTEICSSFRSATAPGYDCISKNAVQGSFKVITPLTYIINLSFNSGVVHQEMKIARVIPLFESGDMSLFTNYRPVSVLPVFSKFLERIVYNRLINFLNKYDILSRNQYGFRKKLFYRTCFNPVV